MSASGHTEIPRTPGCWTRWYSGVLLRVIFRIIPPGVVFAFLGLSLISRADDFWKHKSAAEWSGEEALKVVRRWTWAREDGVLVVRRARRARIGGPTGTHRWNPG